jgi:glycosyltransferase involved in cell wall biosynthesis
MRVLIVIDDLRRAGAQRVIAQEIQELHPKRVDFHVAALAHTPEPSFAPELARRGVEVEYVPGSGLMDPRRVPALCRAINRLEPDLVHTHLTYANILGTLASVLAARPVVASLHNIDVNQCRWPVEKRRVEGLILRNWATRIVIVSAATRLPTCRSFDVPADRIVVLANAVDDSTVALPGRFDRVRKRRELGVLQDEQLLCSVGRLEPSKGHRFLLQALALFQSRTPRHRPRLVVLGGGPDEHSLRRLASRLGLDNVVSFLGVRDDACEIVAASDLFVLPSLTEGLSQALLEAMALSTPVVATNVGGTPDVLEPGRTGWRVQPAHPAALADAIQQALDQPERAQTYARAAHTLVMQGFNSATHVAGLQALYASVAAGKPLPAGWPRTQVGGKTFS